MLSQAIGIEVKAEDLEHRSATLIAAGEAIGDAQFASAWTAIERVVAAYLDRLEAIDIWMTPTLGTEIPRIGVFGPDIRSEEHTSELQSLMRISYAVFCLKKKQQKYNTNQ